MIEETRRVWDSLSEFLLANTHLFDVSIVKNYEKYDKQIKIVSEGLTFSHDGKIEISLEMVENLALRFGFTENDVLLYLVEHETTHLRLGNGYKTGEKIYTTKTIRSYSVYLNEALKQERICLKNSKKFPVSKVLDKENAINMRKIKTYSIKRLKVEGVVKAILRS